MKFWQQVIATLIGVVAGFIFSILLFYLSERWKKASLKKEMIKNVKEEINYNIALLGRLKEKVNDVIQDVSSGNPRLYKEFKFISFQKIFVNSAFGRGDLYDIFSIDEISSIDEMFSYFSDGNDIFADKLLNDLNSTPPTSNQAFVVAMYQQFKKQIGLHRDNLKKLKLVISKAD